MANEPNFSPKIDLQKHISLIYGEGVFGQASRAKLPMRAKTADGILRYASYPIVGLIDGIANEKTAGEVLGQYLKGSRSFDLPIFTNLKEARAKTRADVLILGSAPEGGELPEAWLADIKEALALGMHIISGLHYALKSNAELKKIAEANHAVIWDVRTDVDCSQIPLGSSQAYHIKKPIVLTVGTDAAIGKMTAAYELLKTARKRGVNAGFIPTGQTAVMIEGWGITVDALPADFMAGAVEKMVLEKAGEYDALFVEGQGSLFHPAFSNTAISLLHGAVPTHLVLVHRPSRKHSIGSKLVPLPSVKEAIRIYEEIQLPSYRNAKVIGVALNTSGLTDTEKEDIQLQMTRETGLPAGDMVLDQVFSEVLVSKIFDAES